MEVGMRREVLTLGVLEDQNAILTQQLALEDKVDDLLATFKVVRSIGEDHIELLGATLKVEEDVGLDGVEITKTKALSRLADEVVVHGVDLNRCDGLDSARGELVADGAGAREEIIFRISFCAVAAFIRVLPVTNSGPTTASIATSASAASIEFSLLVTQAVSKPLSRAFFTAPTT